MTESTGNPDVTLLDTSKLVKPNEDTSMEPTPIGDEAEQAAKEYLKNAAEEDLTHFDEDEDPLANVGELTNEGSGPL